MNYLPTSFKEFQELCAGLQSIAIVLATFLGGGWALFQFFSLSALKKAKIDLEKAMGEIEKTKRELIERGVLTIELLTESFNVDREFFLHVRVMMKNIGSGVEIVDWTKARLVTRRFYKADNVKLGASEQALLAWHAPTYLMKEMRLMPGFSTNESFLIGIPQIGVHYIEFSIPVSKATKQDVIQQGLSVEPQDVIEWTANMFVSVPSAA